MNQLRRGGLCFMPSERHAYLIMAHNNFYILEKLLILLDD